MFDPITIRLAGEPKGKGRPRFGNGRTFTPAATRSYEAALRMAAQDAMGARPPLTCPIAIEIIANFPVPKSMSKRDTAKALSGELMPAKKPDWDNLAKMTDALNEVVFKDDCQIVRGWVNKRYSDQPSLVIHVRPLLAEVPA